MRQSLGEIQAAADMPAATGLAAPPVAVLLSTFNGERYLSEQLASFMAQTYPNWVLYWRDDGSSDGTMAIMAEFGRSLGDRRYVACSDGGRLRATRSFLALLRAALAEPNAFFAFSDQDDIWLPEKLAHGVEALRRVPHHHPAMWFCGRTLVDASLQPYGQVLAPRRAPGFPSALTQNLAPGCCMMLNREAARLVDAQPAPEGAWHDWWAYVVVSASGGTVIAGDTADILYRQHSLNLVGEPPGFWSRTAAATRRGAGPFMTLFWRQVAALLAGPAPLPDPIRRQLRIIERANRGGLAARVRALCLPGLSRQTWPETLLFRLWFLLS